MISPNDCSSVVEVPLYFPSESTTTSPRLAACPSGVMAHSTYVRNSFPKDAGRRQFLHIDFDLHVAQAAVDVGRYLSLEEAMDVPWKSTFVQPLRLR